MEFTEKVHAFLAARYYVRLTERFGERGKQAFIHAVQYYAGQRGRRMAQRAIRDGNPLTHKTFMQYGELIMSEAADLTRTECVSLSPDYELHIKRCLWHDQFREMGCLEAGDLYCTYVDEALCRGFNPDLQFKVRANLNSSTHCIHCVLDVNYEKLPDSAPKAEYKRDFSYQCGHLYWAFREVCQAIFETEAIGEAVMADFTDCYGSSMAETLQSWQHTNFNIC